MGSRTLRKRERERERSHVLALMPKERGEIRRGDGERWEKKTGRDGGGW